MSDAGGVIVIRSEDDAWRLLQSILDGDGDERQIESVRFAGWPKFTIKLEVPEATLTPSVMAGLVGFQKELYRSQALARYGDASIRLTKEEKQALEFTVKVVGGSSILDIDAQQAFAELLNVLAQTMTGTQWLILILGLALLYFGRVAWKDYMNDRRERRLEELRVQEKRELLEGLQFLSAQETERTRLLGRAISQNARLPQIDEQADEARRTVLRSLAQTPEADIGGAVLTGEAAEELTKSSRRRSDDVEIQGQFRILRVDTDVVGGFRVRLENQETDEVFFAGVQDLFLSEKHREILQKAEWRKRPVWARITAKRRGEDLVDAIVRDVHDVEAQDREDQAE